MAFGELKTRDDHGSVSLDGIALYTPINIIHTGQHGKCYHIYTVMGDQDIHHA